MVNKPTIVYRFGLYNLHRYKKKDNYENGKFETWGEGGVWKAVIDCLY